MKAILKAENISYNATSNEVFGQDKKILSSISFELYENEILGIAGESGSGKTTLAKILAEIYLPTEGKLDYKFPKDWSNLKTKPVQILFQNSSEIINPIRRVGEIIEEAVKIKFGQHSKSYELMTEALKLAGLDESFIDRRGYELSGGEQQRVALARIISVEPEILILDEPFSAQDVESHLNFVRLIKSISEEKKIVLVIVSHDLNLLKLICSRIMILSDGKIVEIGETENIFAQPKLEVTKKLIQSSKLEIET